jgi:hypothetical protein
MEITIPKFDEIPNMEISASVHEKYNFIPITPREPIGLGNAPD